MSPMLSVSHHAMGNCQSVLEDGFLQFSFFFREKVKLRTKIKEHAFIIPSLLYSIIFRRGQVDNLLGELGTDGFVELGLLGSRTQITFALFTAPLLGRHLTAFPSGHSLILQMRQLAY